MFNISGVRGLDIRVWKIIVCVGRMLGRVFWVSRVEFCIYFCFGVV